MPTPQTPRVHTKGISRRALLKASLAAGVATWGQPLSRPPALWGAEAGLPKRGGILRVRGAHPIHFDPQLTFNFKTHTTLSFVYSTLLRHKLGPEIQPGTFLPEPHLAERWESPDDTTYIFQIPSDLVVKSQATDIIDLLLQLIRHPNGVHRSCHHRKSRRCGALNICSPVGYH